MTSGILHRSRIGPEFLVPLILVVGTVTVIMVVNMNWAGLAVCGLVIAFVTHIYAGTHYRITSDHHLLIKCGFVVNLDIDIQDIEWIKPSRELTSAPALSMDRLEIQFKGGRTLISPKDKEKFMDDLRRINPKL